MVQVLYLRLHRQINQLNKLMMISKKDLKKPWNEPRKLLMVFLLNLRMRLPNHPRVNIDLYW